MQKLPSHGHKKAGRKSPTVDVPNFFKYQVQSGAIRYEGLSGKNTGRLPSEASISDKQTKLPVCASLK